jgi:uncharacterized membrane protein (DUF485 family)
MTTAVGPTRERKWWDFVLTIILLVVYLGWSLLCCFAGALVALVGDSCGASSTCDNDLLGTAFVVGVFGPVALAVIFLVFAIVWIARRRIAFWIPIVGSVLAAGVVVLAYLIATSAVSAIS